MITLGFDPSMTGFGWCIHDSEATGTDRIVTRGRWATPSKMVFVKRYMNFREHVTQLLTEYPQIEAVGVESPVYGEQWSPGLYALFVYVNEVVFEFRKDVVFFDPGTVKMLAKLDPKIRKGKMFKADMVSAAKADMPGFKGRLNHNEADAYHVARFAARFFLRLNDTLTDDDLTPSEYQAFSKIHTLTRGKRAGLEIRSGAIFKENSRFFLFSKAPEDGMMRKTRQWAAAKFTADSHLKLEVP
jgi:Holliday junction resolvasome RuvABC endonuclease subunit